MTKESVDRDMYEMMKCSVKKMKEEKIKTVRGRKNGKVTNKSCWKHLKHYREKQSEYDLKKDIPNMEETVIPRQTKVQHLCE